MKLRNKKTGEVVSLDGEIIYDDKIRLLKHYDSLAEFNEEWEDYEEPKGSALDLMILTLANFIENEPDEDKVDLEDCKQMLEKLKAWKRLKETEFRFHDYSALGYGRITFSHNIEDMDDEGEIGQLRHDLDLLFGGKE